MSDVASPEAGTSEGDLTILLQAYARGDLNALHVLIERVYTDLHGMAARQLRSENRNPLMGPTALVNEAYLRLVGGKAPKEWANRRHFFAAVSETMRRILVDQARQRLAMKRGGRAVRHTAAELAAAIEVPDEALLDIDTVFQQFAEIDPEKAELVRLRFFVGLPESEAAALLGISRATANRYWTYARAWLFNRLKLQAPDLAAHDEIAPNS